MTLKTNLRGRRAWFVVYLVLLALVIFTTRMVLRGPPPTVHRRSSTVETHTSSSPLIFVGGFPRSGTTLMRVLLDTHPLVRCGPETRIIPRILKMTNKWLKTPEERKRLANAHLLGEPIDRAVAAFILEIMRQNGVTAPRLCNKDPLALTFIDYLAHLFPKAKFVLMMRDGRAVAHSFLKRSVKMEGVDESNPWDVFSLWNTSAHTMTNECSQVGASRCFRLKYEDLVLQPERNLRRVLAFLDLPWSPNLLHHDQALKRVKGFHLSKSEKSTNQVVKAIHIKAISEWCQDPYFDQKFVMTAHHKLSMLTKLGYNVQHIPPVCRKAKAMVQQFTNN